MKAKATAIPVYRGNHLGELIEQYQAASADRKAAHDREQDLRAAILSKMAHRPALRVGEWVLTARHQPAVEPRTITEADVGRVLRGRRAHIVLGVHHAGEDEEAAA